MNDEFNPEEALEIACQIERNGAAFYRDAAKLVELAKSRKLLLELAAMEDQHEVVFESMKEKTDENELLFLDLDDTVVKYLQAIASNHVFVAGKTAANVFSQNSDVTDVLRTALQAEFASIAYFQGLLNNLSADFDSSKLLEIVLEEQEHVVIINKKIMEYSNMKERSQ